jgi:hypothetical protein
MSVRVTTDAEAAVKAVFAGIGVVILAIIAPFVPPLLPPGYLAYLTWDYAVQVWGWHPLFGGLLAGATLIAGVTTAFASFYLLPRSVATGLIALYVAGSYGWTFHDLIGSDSVWSGAAAVVAGAVGIPAGWWLKNRLNEKFGKSFGDLIAVARPIREAARV